jgi:hypothetical protein
MYHSKSFVYPLSYWAWKFGDAVNVRFSPWFAYNVLCGQLPAQRATFFGGHYRGPRLPAGSENSDACSRLLMCAPATATGCNLRYHQVFVRSQLQSEFRWLLQQEAEGGDNPVALCGRAVGSAGENLRNSLPPDGQGLAAVYMRCGDFVGHFVHGHQRVNDTSFLRHAWIRTWLPGALQGTRVVVLFSNRKAHVEDAAQTRVCDALVAALRALITNASGAEVYLAEEEGSAPSVITRAGHRPKNDWATTTKIRDDVGCMARSDTLVLLTPTSGFGRAVTLLHTGSRRYVPIDIELLTKKERQSVEAATMPSRNGLHLLPYDADRDGVAGSQLPVHKRTKAFVHNPANFLSLVVTESMANSEERIERSTAIPWNFSSKFSSATVSNRKHAARDSRGRIREIMSDPNNLFIPRCPGAGRVLAGTGLMVAHNGVVLGQFSYTNKFGRDIFASNRGVHEPAEERLFAEILARLPANSTMVELGAYWSYYSIWFVRAIEGATAVAVESDHGHLQLGKQNAAANGATEAISFYQGYVGRPAFAGFACTLAPRLHPACTPPAPRLHLALISHCESKQVRSALEPNGDSIPDCA